MRLLLNAVRGSFIFGALITFQVANAQGDRGRGQGRGEPGRETRDGDARRGDADRGDASGRQDRGAAERGREGGRPGAGRPEGGRPDGGRPEGGRPEGGRPEAQGFRPGGFRPGGPGNTGARGGGPGFGNRESGMSPAMLTRMIPVLAALDTDRDGVISKSEIENASASLKKADRNGDGKLSGDELRPGMGFRGNTQARGDRGRDANGPEGRGPEGRAGFMERMFGERDANDDGMLKGDEIPERMAGRLSQIDQNSDAAISREEFENMMSRVREAGGAGARGGNGPGGARGPGQRPGGPGQRPGGDIPRRPGSDN